MKKTVRILSILFAVMMIVTALVGCNGDTSTSNGSDSSQTTTTDALSKIDLESSETQAITDERAELSVLVETRNTWLGNQTSFTGTDLEKLTYDDFVAHIGCDASEFLGGDSVSRKFVWYAKDNESAQLLAIFYNYGNGWILGGAGYSNIQ